MASGTCTILIILTISMCLAVAKSIHLDFPAAFNFGDSNSDTGGLVSAGIESLNPPYGQNFFHKPSGRYSDGHLIIDFLMDAMDLPFLNAYLDSIAMASFRKGCDFAVVASTIVQAAPFSISPFSFGVQVTQFLRLKNQVLELLDKKVGKFLPMEYFFHKGLYMFDIGQNDLASSFYSKPTLDEILASIPSVLVEFETGMKKLFDEGARNFGYITQVLLDACLRI